MLLLISFVRRGQARFDPRRKTHFFYGAAQARLYRARTLAESTLRSWSRKAPIPLPSSARCSELSPQLESALPEQWPEVRDNLIGLAARVDDVTAMQ